MSNLPLVLRVARKIEEATDIVSFELVSVQGGCLPPFTAGAHLDIEVAPGLIRQYSLCNAPGETHRYLICVLRDPRSRGGSLRMCDDVKEGDTLHASLPRNLFPLAVDMTGARLLAGGIGITPILAMAESLSAAHTPFSLVYAGRSRSRMAFVERLRASDFAASVTFHFDDEALGVVDLAPRLSAPRAGEHVYVCGTGGFIRAVLDTAAKEGWSEASVHREFFSTPTLSAQSDEAQDRPFMVRLARSGLTLAVPADRTLLAVLQDAGIDAPYSCETGVCGTCLTRVIEGEPDHRDQILTDTERAANDRIALCCSRSRTECLVIEL